MPENKELTATQLWRTAGDPKSFSEWIEEKNKAYAEYQTSGGKMTFIEWEKKNQTPVKWYIKYSPVLAVVAVAAIVIAASIYKNYKQKKT